MTNLSFLRNHRSAVSSSPESTPVEDTLNEVLDTATSTPPPPPAVIELTGPQYLKTLPGASAPLPYFDPLAISSKVWTTAVELDGCRAEIFVVLVNRKDSKFSG